MASVTQVGTNSVNGGTSLVVTISPTVPVGDRVVLMLFSGNSPTDGVNGIVGVVDSSGNKYTQEAVNYDNSDHNTVVIYSAYIQTALSTSITITLASASAQWLAYAFDITPTAYGMGQYIDQVASATQVNGTTVVVTQKDPASTPDITFFGMTYVTAGSPGYPAGYTGLLTDVAIPGGRVAQAAWLEHAFGAGPPTATGQIAAAASSAVAALVSFREAQYGYPRVTAGAEILRAFNMGGIGH